MKGRVNAIFFWDRVKILIEFKRRLQCESTACASRQSPTDVRQSHIMKRSLVVIAILLMGGLMAGVAFLGHSLRRSPNDSPGQTDRESDTTPAVATPEKISEQSSAAETRPQLDTAAVISTSVTQQRQQLDQRRLSPQQDGWPTEAFAEAALKQLSQLGHSLTVAEAAPQSFWTR